MKRATYFLVLISAWGLGISSSQAIPLEPASYSIQFSGVPGAVNNSAASPQSDSYTYFGGSIDVSAAAAAIAQPAASANVVSGGCTTSCAGGSYQVWATVNYQIAVIGAADVMVPYYFDTAGQITRTGQFGSGSVRVSLIAPGGIGLTGFTASTGVTNVGDLFCGPNGCINSTQHVNLRSNTAYWIQIAAWAGAATNFDASIFAWADPYIYIDPTFVGGEQFSLQISDGIGNATLETPIPAALPLFASVLAGGGLMTWRRKRKAAELAA